MRAFTVLHEPVLTTENPDMRPTCLEHLDRVASDFGHQGVLGDDCQIRLRYHPAIEPDHRRREFREDRAARASRAVAGRW